MNNQFKVGIIRQPIDVEECHCFLNDSSCGAANLFIGTVRQFTGLKRSGILAKSINVQQDKSELESTCCDPTEPLVVRTVALEYDCYEPFATAEMRRLLEKAATQWPIVKGLILHRVGRLELGEASIAVGISTPHRKASFQAGDAIVDWAKKSVPIWKREILADGTNQWIHPEFPKEEHLVHSRLDLGRSGDQEIQRNLQKKWKELSGEGILKVVFQNERQQKTIRQWCQSNSLKGIEKSPSIIMIQS